MLWPLLDAQRQQAIGVGTATSAGTTVTASATTHTKGAWTELVASTAFDSAWLTLYALTSVNETTAETSTLVDVAIGASGSELVVISNLMVGGNEAATRWDFPLALPAGSRIAVRIQSSRASHAITFGGSIVGGGSIPMDAGMTVETYGADTATSRGVSPAAPAATHTKGAWTQVVASTVRSHRWLMVALGAPATATASASSGLLDVGIGAAGSEQAVIENLPYEVGNAERIRTGILTIPCPVPAGSRLSARYQASSTAVASTPQVALYGIA